LCGRGRESSRCIAPVRRRWRGSWWMIDVEWTCLKDEEEGIYSEKEIKE
jgi:hypothetical protein